MWYALWSSVKPAVAKSGGQFSVRPMATYNDSKNKKKQKNSNKNNYMG
jgi:hypothetical protein